MRKHLAIGLMAAALALPGCVEVDGSLGEGLVDKSLRYKTNETGKILLEDIQSLRADDLSGYSSTRLTVGAIRDEVLGLSTREAAFTLIPAEDSIDLQDNYEFVSFTLRFALDTISCNNDSQASIMQNLRVTRLTQPLPDAWNAACTQVILHGSQLITEGIPVYCGSGDLAFSFTEEFAQEYIDALQDFDISGLDDTQKRVEYKHWIQAHPGIHLAMDPPDGYGGRFNLFGFSCLSVSSNYYVRNNNVAFLTVRKKGTEDETKDILFIPGEPAFYDEAAYVEKNTSFPQNCFNRTTHEAVAAGADLWTEGGGGLKQVISARELQEKTLAAIERNEGAYIDPERIFIVKASLVLPMNCEGDARFENVKYFPTILSPTIKTTTESDVTIINDQDEEETVTKSFTEFAGITDSSVSTENQGNIDRSNLRYAPDITYHLQSILDRDDLDTATDADIWLLTISTEKVANASGSYYDNQYYQQMLYAQYYNSIYGGYGGYGYGGYGYGNDYYSNYYNYMMLSEMMNSSTQQTYSYVAELDKDRFYRARLYAPGSANAPYLLVTYAITAE